MAGSDNMENCRKALVEKILRLTSKGHSLETQIKGLALRRWDATTEPMSYLNEPSICLSVQGAKHIVMDGESYEYNRNKYLITSIDVPVVANIIEASKEEPYLAVVYKLDLQEVSQILANNVVPLPEIKQAEKSIAVSMVSEQILDSFNRLLGLLDEPENIPVIAPLIEKEILFRLLKSEQGMRLRQIAMEDTHSHQIAKAIKWLKVNYKESLKVDDLAFYVSMSTSSLYQHFKTLTSMTPLQYQKWLRLHEARRLMLNESFDAADAAFEVGYESPSHFSREYKRLFGAPPIRDINNLSRLVSARN